jgi:hypothetical protein
MQLYPRGGEKNFTLTFLHVPPGSYVDCRVRYLSVEQRIEIGNIPRNADDANNFIVTDEGAVVSTPGLFAFLSSDTSRTKGSERDVADGTQSAQANEPAPQSFVQAEP